MVQQREGLQLREARVGARPGHELRPPVAQALEHLGELRVEAGREANQAEVGVVDHRVTLPGSAGGCSSNSFPVGEDLVVDRDHGARAVDQDRGVQAPSRGRAVDRADDAAVLSRDPRQGRDRLARRLDHLRPRQASGRKTRSAPLAASASTRAATRSRDALLKERLTTRTGQPTPCGPLPRHALASTRNANDTHQVPSVLPRASLRKWQRPAVGADAPGPPAGGAGHGAARVRPIGAGAVGARAGLLGLRRRRVLGAARAVGRRARSCVGAFGGGVTYFDTAEVYNDGAERIARSALALRGLPRQGLVIGTKVSPAPRAARRAAEVLPASLEAPRHRPPRSLPRALARSRCPRSATSIRARPRARRSTTPSRLSCACRSRARCATSVSATFRTEQAAGSAAPLPRRWRRTSCPTTCSRAR